MIGNSKKILCLALAIYMLSGALVAAESSDRYAGDPAGWWNSLWNDAHFSYDGYARSTLLRGSQSFGGGLSLGVETDRFKFEGYGQVDYFMEPLGGNGGAAALELMWEAGINLNWKFMEFWAFDVWASCDLGYYSQVLKGLPYPPYDQLVTGFSGLMVRPKLMTELKIARYYGITLGVYYQFPVYPAYSDYRGLGIVLSIM